MKQKKTYTSAAQKLSQDRLISEGRAEAKNIAPIPDCGNVCRKESHRLDLLGFMTTYCPARFPLTFSGDHKRAIGLLQSTILEGGQFAIAMPRGSGKTTLIEVAALWALLYGHRRFIFIIGADSDAAKSLVRSIRQDLEDNDLLNEDFPEACYPIRKLEGVSQKAKHQHVDGKKTDIVWTATETRLPNTAAGGGSVIRASGITGRIRGAKAAMSDGSQVRPDLVLIDDPQTDESAKSPSQVATRWDAIRSTVLGLAGPGQRIACLAAVTVIAKDDLADKMLDRSRHPEWQGVKTRMLITIPTRQDLWDAYTTILREDMRAEKGRDRATKFYADNRALMDLNGQAAWTERYASDELSAIQHAMNLRITRGEEAFAAEFQNDPMDAQSDPTVEQIDGDAVAEKVNRHERGVVPVQGTVLTAFADVQKSALYWMVVAWNPSFGGDIIDYGTSPDQGRRYFQCREIEKTIESEHKGAPWQAAFFAVASELTQSLIGREWRRDNGSVAKIDQMLIDANWGESTDAVYNFCRRSPFSGLLLPSHGRGFKAGERSIDEWQKKPGDRIGLRWRIPANSKRQTRHCMFDAGYWKSFVAARLLASPGDPSSLALFGERASEHRLLGDHLSAETRTRVTAMGRTCDQWSLKPTRDNHWLDCLVGCAVAASIRGVKVDENAIIRKITGKDLSSASKQAVMDRVKPRLAPRSGGWLDGGNGSSWL